MPVGIQGRNEINTYTIQYRRFTDVNVISPKATILCVQEIFPLLSTQNLSTFMSQTTRIVSASVKIFAKAFSSIPHSFAGYWNHSCVSSCKLLGLHVFGKTPQRNIGLKGSCLLPISAFVLWTIVHVGTVHLVSPQKVLFLNSWPRRLMSTKCSPHSLLSHSLRHIEMDSITRTVTSQV